MAPDRAVTIYLPPRYYKKETRRYPVMYLLHGMNEAMADKVWTDGTFQGMTLNSSVDAAIKAGRTKEMIL